MLFIDLFLVLFIGVLAFMGLRSGLIHESVTMVGLGVALVIAGNTYQQFGPLFKPYLHTRGMSQLGAFLAILVVVWGLMFLFGALMRSMLEGVRLGWLDNLGGVFLGAFKGIFLSELIVLVLMSMPDKDVKAAVMGSWIGGSLALLAPKVLELVPPVLRYWQPF